mmetsp:Transcript_22543/g.52193  ORF Transcript_22543/g.52193 Transcript_22543/m.52193 type:complete len:1123 (-) Transcript_22543:911-4279(-)
MHAGVHEGGAVMHGRSMASESKTGDDQDQSQDSGNEGLCIQDFVLRRVIGQGGFGKVWLAQLRSDKSLVCLKMIEKRTVVTDSTDPTDTSSADPHTSASEAKAVEPLDHQVSRAQQEISLLSQLRHPFIVSMIDAFENYVAVFLVLEYVQGGTLFKLQNTRPMQVFTESEARFYASEIYLALDHLHTLDIAFRDLKPENVLVGLDGHIMLTDFGLSKTKPKEVDMLTSVLGTPEYMAPEVINQTGHGLEVDWWAMGCLIYEMVCKMSPFVATTIAGLFRNVLLGQRRPYIIGKDGDEVQVSDALDSLVGGLLTVTVANRLTSSAIRAHSFFYGLDWEQLHAKQIEPPLIPTAFEEKRSPTSEVGRANNGGFAVAHNPPTTLQRHPPHCRGEEGKATGFDDFVSFLAPSPKVVKSKHGGGGRDPGTQEGGSMVQRKSVAPMTPNGTKHFSDSEVRPGLQRTVASNGPEANEGISTVAGSSADSNTDEGPDVHLSAGDRMTAAVKKLALLKRTSCVVRSHWESILDERLVITQPSAIMAQATNKIGNSGYLSGTKDVVGIDMLLDDIEASKGVLPAAAKVGLDWTGETVLDDRHLREADGAGVQSSGERTKVGMKTTIIKGRTLVFFSQIYLKSCEASTPMVGKLIFTEEFKIIRIALVLDAVGYARQISRCIAAAASRMTTPAAVHSSIDSRREECKRDCGEGDGDAHAHATNSHANGNSSGGAVAASPRTAHNPNLRPGLGIHELQIVSVLGQGAYGTVWKAVTTKSNTAVALKCQLKSEILRHKDGLRRVVRERDILETIDFPFIVRLLGSFQNETHVFLLMTFVDGGNLFALQSKQPTQRFSESVARHYGAEIFLALEHLHSHSIVFRDLKPENVLVDARGQHVSLTDFGLAHVVTDYKRLESFVGTPEYMAPEIFSHEVYNGEEVDWWAYGCLIYEMVAGYSPFAADGSDNRAIYKNIVKGKRRPLPFKLSDSLSEMLNGLLQVDPTKREGGTRFLRKHAWFASTNWQATLQKEVAPPVFSSSVEWELNRRLEEEADEGNSGVFEDRREVRGEGGVANGDVRAPINPTAAARSRGVYVPKVPGSRLRAASPTGFSETSHHSDEHVVWQLKLVRSFMMLR